MESTSPGQWSPGRIRRWRVPPPLTRGGELLEGAEILDELTGPTAVLLWKSLRNVMLWAMSSPQEQADLFAPGAHARRLADILAAEPEPELQEPLHVFAELLANPGDANRERLALACRHVAQWADVRSHFRVALAFTQAAALTCPADADLAYHVGRLARYQLQHARAESWYRRAIMLGRQVGNWQAYSRAYNGLGSLAMQRGSLPGARRAHIKALRSARRHGITEVEAQALHDLFLVACETDDLAVAHRYAASALRLYGRSHPNVPVLAHDLSALWVRRGDFERALWVLQAVLPHQEGGMQLLAYANLARAAGNLGNQAIFESAWEQAHTLLRGFVGTRFASQSLLNLARGAVGMLQWQRAVDAAEQALQIARQSGEANIVFEAEAVLDQARGRQKTSAPQLQTVHASAPEWSEQADNLAEGLRQALTAGAA